MSALTMANAIAASPAPSLAISAIRRKPTVTYQSPSAHYTSSLRLEGPTISFSRASSCQRGSSSSSTSQPAHPIKPSIPLPHPSKQTISTISQRKREKRPMGPPLPFYHPLGRLALSLPELDPTTLGLPPRILVQDPARRSSGRARRPAAKVRDAQDARIKDPIGTATDDAMGPTITFVPPEPLPDVKDVKEKPSPRRRRNAGGAAAKRKRREAEDVDVNLLPKRTRTAHGAAAVARQAASADTLSHEDNAPSTRESPAPAEGLLDVAQEKKPERRVTRSRGVLSRRESSASEATVTSVSVSIATGVLSTGKNKTTEVDERRASPTNKSEKQESAKSTHTLEAREEEKSRGKVNSKGATP